MNIYTLIAYKPSGSDRNCDYPWKSNLELYNFDDPNKIAKTWADIYWVNHNTRYEADHEFDILINGVSMFSSYMSNHCYTDEYDSLRDSLEPVMDEITKKRDDYLAEFRKIAEDKKLAEEARLAKEKADKEAYANKIKEENERFEFARLSAKYGKV
jgi:hypothetical protein